MKLLITGCAGFIGSNFTQYWLNKYRNDVIVGVDKLTYAANLEALKIQKSFKNFVFYKEDICNKKAIDKIFAEENPEVVINFAAESHVDRSITDSEIFVGTNVTGVHTLLECCLKHKIKRFHQISTDEVYGDLPLEGDEKFKETSPLKPSSPYSASKAAADLLTLAYYRTFGLPITISRSANNYGKFQHYEKFIPLIIKNAKANDKIPVYGDGKNVRDWLFVDDHCTAIDKILKFGKVGEIYNVGADNEISNIEIVRSILQILDKPESLIEYVSDRKGHDRKYSLDFGKIERTCGWKPTAAFLEELKTLTKIY